MADIGRVFKALAIMRAQPQGAKGTVMTEKRIGDPCPKCAARLIRRAKRMVVRSGGPGDVAYCAGCNAAWDIEEPALALRLAEPLTA